MNTKKGFLLRAFGALVIIADSDIVSQCRPESRQKNIHLLLKDFRNCPTLHCTATTEKMDRDITITVVDVRLRRARVRGECSSTVLTINDRNLKCDKNNYFFFNEVIAQDKTISLTIANLFTAGTEDTPAMVWINFKADRDIILRCRNESGNDAATTLTTELTTEVHLETKTVAETTIPVTPVDTFVTSGRTQSSSAGIANAPAEQSFETPDPVPIVVSVSLLVLLVAVASIVFFLWRKGQCRQNPEFRSVFNRRQSGEFRSSQAYNYVDPTFNNLDRDNERARNELPAAIMPPAGNYFELEPQYTEPDVRNSIYAEIPEESCQPKVVDPDTSEYDKLGAKQKTVQPIKTANEYSHIKLNEEQTPYSHIGKHENREHGEGSNRQRLSEYSHVQPGQGFCTDAIETNLNDRNAPNDITEYSHLANYRYEDRTEMGETVEDRNTNVDGTDTYSHLHTSKP